MEFLYSSNDGLSVYTTNPLNQTKKVPYKDSISDLAVSRSHLYILNDSSLVLYSKSGFNILSKPFTDCKVKAIGDSLIGVQSKSELTVYTHSFACLNVFAAQCSFSARDILLLGSMNTVKAYVKDRKAFEVAMPDYITCLAADPLFTRIYCATQDNNIYVLDLNGEKLRVMEYHTRPVTEMRLGFTGECLYTTDGTRLCAWNTESCLVMGFVDVEAGIEGFETFLVDEFACDVDKAVI